MADAYAFAEDGHHSKEIDLLAKIDRFGIEAVLGRKTFYFGELRALIFAENIANAYRARANAKNWAEWAAQNKVMSQVLIEAEQLCHL